MKQTEYSDPLLEKLLRQSTVYEPSADITQRIMASIQENQVVSAKNISFVIRYRYWLIESFAIALFVIAFLLFPSLIDYPKSKTFFDFFNPYINTFNGISSLLRAQPLIPIILFALTTLFVIDKLLSRLFHPNAQHS